MFMMSVRLSRKRMLIAALALVLVISASFIWAGRANSVMEAANPEPVRSEEKVNTKKSPAKTNEQRLEFISSFGWEVEPEPIEILEVIIPKEFDEVYDQYNSMQKIQGCDLKPIAGKRCKRYSYIVNNYPGQDENVRINLVVYKNKVVGGDVCSLEVGGFMHGFAPPAA